MKSVKAEAFLEMLKLIGCAVGGALLAFGVIELFGADVLLLILVGSILTMGFYTMFKIKCGLIEMRREREAREAARAAEKA